MILNVRMNEIYNQLHKSIKESLISHKIVLTLHSYNATICAFNGINHTIESIIKELNTILEVKIEDYSQNGNIKSFYITRNNKYYVTNVNLNVQLIEGKNQILFEFFINMFG